MADTRSDNNPRDHRNVGRGHGSTTDESSGRGTRRGRRPKSSASGRGNSSDANSGQRNNGGRGGRGSGPSSTAPVGGLPHRHNHITQRGIGRNWTSRNSSQPTTTNGFNNFNSNRQPSSELSNDQMQEFLQTGLSAITTSAESRQIFINNLATEDGLARIKQIVETDFSMSYSVLKPMFDPHCILFLRLISNKEIRLSLVLENAVGTMYNVIYGHDGKRGIGFFRNIADCLARMASEVEDRREVEKALFFATEALLATLTRNQGAAIKTKFNGVVEQLYSCYSAEDINYGSSSPEIRFAHENTLKIKDILNMGDTISEANIRATITSRKKQPELRSPELHVVQIWSPP